MDFLSVRFFLFIIFALLIFYFSPRKYVKSFVIPLINIAFVLNFISSAYELVPFILFLILCYIFIKLIEIKPRRRNFILCIVVIVAVFSYLKKYAFISFFPFIENTYLIVGLSYVLFRVLQLIIDIYQGAIKENISIGTFINYTLFFLKYVSGPIQRFEKFREQELNIRKENLNQEVVYKSFSRIINGYIKITLISAFFDYFYKYFRSYLELGNFEIFHMLIYAGACLFFTLFVYFNFSGYMDIVIGIGQLFGFNLPENFSKPFSSESFLEFWSRWHITLSNWCKYYIFNPLVKALSYRWSNPKLVPYYGVFSYFVTFLILGVWHGSTWAFVVFGLLLGLGVSINKLYEVELRKRLGKKRYRKLMNNKIYGFIGSGLTFSYFCISLTCLWMNAEKTLWLIGNFGIFLFIFGGLLAGAVKALYRLFLLFWKKIYLRACQLSKYNFLRQSYLSVKLLILIYYVYLSMHSVPEFVYKGF